MNGNLTMASCEPLDTVPEAPGQPQAISQTLSSVTLQWAEPAKTGLCVEGYTLFTWTGSWDQAAWG